MNYLNQLIKAMLAGILLLTSMHTMAEQTITLKNTSKYPAKMIVTFLVNKKVGDQTIRVPETLQTGKVSNDKSETLTLPSTLDKKAPPISVYIKKDALIKELVLHKTLPANFIGNVCFEAKGRRLNPKAGFCKGSAPVVQKAYAPAPAGSAQYAPIPGSAGADNGRSISMATKSGSTKVGAATSFSVKQIVPEGALYQQRLYSVINGQFSTNEGLVPPGCLGQLITELNGDDTVAAIFLNRSNIRGCIVANDKYPGGDSKAVSYKIKDAFANDNYYVEVCQNTGGSMGASCNHIQVRFVNRTYHKKGVGGKVLSLEKIGEW